METPGRLIASGNCAFPTFKLRHGSSLLAPEPTACRQRETRRREAFPFEWEILKAEMQPGFIERSGKSEPKAGSQASELVAELLRRIEGTNLGAEYKQEVREEIVRLMGQASGGPLLPIKMKNRQPRGARRTVLARQNRRVAEVASANERSERALLGHWCARRSCETARTPVL